MSHDENPLNVITGFTFADANPYVPPYKPLPPGTPSPRPSPIYPEIRPRPAPKLPLSKTNNEEHKRQRGLQDGKHSERTVGRPTRKAHRTGSGVTATSNQPAWRNKTSTVKAPQISNHDSATQSPRSRSHDYPSYDGESAPQVPVETLQKALKAHVLQSLRVLRKIIMDRDVFNLNFETIEGWMAEIEGVDAVTILIASSTAAKVLAPFERLDSILTECITASGPMRSLTIRDQALELLKYILAYAEEYYLVQSSHVYLDIGRWIERITQTNEEVK
ncbi:hypothetical protein N7530_008850 [Penicillium desertorum]|uniref:Uncharacterized protein n=1 Tax=Penicillium desertorum TaxID=1303715 RepID=A0A9W9WQ03_9EURO|nr:hypothetical protein N7530_008850 [Penicillium desertorum]